MRASVCEHACARARVPARARLRLRARARAPVRATCVLVCVPVSFLPSGTWENYQRTVNTTACQVSWRGVAWRAC
eukprot:10793453-Alexandrium_andersonii.AAC.1